MTERGTVFLVDDDEALRRALARLLSAAGFRVRSFGSAEEFLEAFDPEDPGCLLLDVRMPGESGLELHERLRRAGGAPPVVFLTAHADASTRRRALRNGAIEFLEKPAPEDDLVGALERALARDAARRSTR